MSQASRKAMVTRPPASYRTQPYQNPLGEEYVRIARRSIERRRHKANVKAYGWIIAWAKRLKRWSS